MDPRLLQKSGRARSGRKIFLAWIFPRWSSSVASQCRATGFVAWSRGGRCGSGVEFGNEQKKAIAKGSGMGRESEKRAFEEIDGGVG